METSSHIASPRIYSSGWKGGENSWEGPRWEVMHTDSLISAHFSFLTGLKGRLEILLHDERSDLIAAGIVGRCWEYGCGLKENFKDTLEKRCHRHLRGSGICCVARRDSWELFPYLRPAAHIFKLKVMTGLLEPITCSLRQKNQSKYIKPRPQAYYSSHVLYLFLTITAGAAQNYFPCTVKNWSKPVWAQKNQYLFATTFVLSCTCWRNTCLEVTY